MMYSCNSLVLIIFSMVYYAVARPIPYIYDNWFECQQNVMGYSNALFKKFDLLYEAEEFVESHKERKNNDMNIDLQIDESLTVTQKNVVNKFIKGNNIFITGPGGCGKSYLIGEIINIAEQMGRKINVTALTGCAAVLLGHNAKTLNSWSGIGIANKDVETIIQSIITNKRKRKKWLNCDVLIVDEVSMLSKRIFEILDTLGKQIRRSDKPFGGIQVIFSGDFYQLPPVGDNFDGSNQFCFESEKWEETFNDNQVCLKKVFRQTDEVYKKILNQIRKAKISKDSYDILMSCVDKKHTSDIEPVRLYPKKYIVDEINEKYNDKLCGQQVAYGVKLKQNKVDKDNGTNDITNEKEKSQIMGGSSIKYNENLQLKVGSQVMCIINYDMESEQKICNGSCGKVTGFTINNEPIVKFHNGRIIEMPITVQKIEYDEKDYEVEYMPLILSWAMTIHKSQGASLDIAEVDIGSDIFECGQTYVALSRVRSLDGLYLKSFDVQKIKIKKAVKEFYEMIKNINP